jgi:hypothetical protein
MLIDIRRDHLDCNHQLMYLSFLVKVNSRHTGLPGDTGGDDDNLSASQSLLDTITSAHVPRNPTKNNSLILLETLDDRVGVDVRDVGSDSGSTSDIVERQAGDQGVGLEEQRHGLTDTTCGSDRV